MTNRMQRGFSLLEVMVTVTIIGILAAIAYPAYSSYLVKGNRSAAQEFLVEVATKEQQFLADTRAYQSTLNAMNMTVPAAVAKNYAISIDLQDGPPPRFTVTATPIAGSKQVADGNLSIDSSGAKLPTDKW